MSNSGNRYNGPISVGPGISGVGVGLSKSLMLKLKLNDGDVVYFKLTE